MVETLRRSARDLEGLRFVFVGCLGIGVLGGHEASVARLRGFSKVDLDACASVLASPWLRCELPPVWWTPDKGLRSQDVHRWDAVLAQEDGSEEPYGKPAEDVEALRRRSARSSRRMRC